MNKKIKTLVQKYEKDMQFENRFDELKDKLDLIPDADIKSEVYTIKRKLMPAYMMMIVLLMLVTGLIGLQFGLNSSFVGGPDNVDKVDVELMEIADFYDREAASTVIIDEFAKVYVYIGIKNDENILVFSGKASNNSQAIRITSNGQVVELIQGDNYKLINIDEESSIEVFIEVLNGSEVVSSKSITFDFSENFEYLGR